MWNVKNDDWLVFDDWSIWISKNILIISSILFSFATWIIWPFLWLSWLFLILFNLLYHSSFSTIHTWIFWIWIFLCYVSYASMSIYERYKDESWKIIWLVNFFSILLKVLVIIWLSWLYFMSFVQVMSNKNHKVEQDSLNYLIWWTEIRMVQTSKEFKKWDNWIESKEMFEINQYKTYILNLLWKFKI